VTLTCKLIAKKVDLRITRRLVGLSGSSDKTARTTKNPMFRKQHYDAIAELIGQKIVYGVMDDKDYRIVEKHSHRCLQKTIRHLTKSDL
jgi:hypothetical protein